MADLLWSVVRRAQDPFSRRKRRCGLKGYMGAGGCWPLGWPGEGVGFLGTKSLGCWGWLEVGWEGTKTPHGLIAKGHLPFHSL